MERDKLDLYATALLMTCYLDSISKEMPQVVDFFLFDAEMRSFLRKSGKISEISDEKLVEIIEEMKDVARNNFKDSFGVRDYFMLASVGDTIKDGPFPKGSFEAFAYDPVKGEVAIAILKCQFLFRMHLTIGVGIQEYALVVARRLAIPAFDALVMISVICMEALDDYVEFKRRTRD